MKILFVLFYFMILCFYKSICVIKIYGLNRNICIFLRIIGSPVWSSTSGPVNTCADLDWIRGLAAHLWYLTHPLSSLPDALHQFELAWRGTGPAGPYSSGPSPDYADTPVIGQQIPILESDSELSQYSEMWLPARTS